MEPDYPIDVDFNKVLDMAEKRMDVLKSQLQDERHKYLDLAADYEQKNTAYAAVFEQNQSLLASEAWHQSKLAELQAHLDHTNTTTANLTKNNSDFIHNTLIDIRTKNTNLEARNLENSLMLQENITLHKSLSKIKKIHLCETENIKAYKESICHLSDFLVSKDKISTKRIEDHIDTLQELLEKYSQIKTDFFVANAKNEDFEKFISSLEKSYQAKIDGLQKSVDGLMSNYICAKNEIFDMGLKSIKKNEKFSEVEGELKNLNLFLKAKNLSADKESFLQDINCDSRIQNEMDDKLVVTIDNTQESVMICGKPDESLVIVDRSISG